VEDGIKPFHAGVCCMVAAPDGDIAQDDLECTANDELEGISEIFDDLEKPASSIITMSSTKGILKSEVICICLLKYVKQVQTGALFRAADS